MTGININDPVLELWLRNKVNMTEAVRKALWDAKNKEDGFFRTKSEAENNLDETKTKLERIEDERKRLIDRIDKITKLLETKVDEKNDASN